MKTHLIIVATGVVLLILFAHRFQKGRICFIIGYIVTILYCVCFSGNRIGRIGFGNFNIKFPLPILVAIIDHHYGYTTNRSVLNILIFIPFGYLFSEQKYKEKNDKWLTITLAGFFFSLLIEISQLVFGFGVFELDDLVKNTIGTAIGYGIWRVLENPGRHKKDTDI